MFENDKIILRELGARYAYIAQQSQPKQNVENWKKHNGLKPNKAMIVIDQIPWHEMNINEELTLGCLDEFCRSIEWDIRQALYRYKYFPCDMSMLPYIEIQKVVTDTGIGISTINNDDNEAAQSHTFVDQISDYEDLEKLVVPTVIYDEEETMRRYHLAKDIFKDIIDVKLIGIQPSLNLWDNITSYRGIEPCLYDFADRPEFLHDIVERLVDIRMETLDQFEALNLLDPNISTVHCSYTFTEEPLSNDFDVNHVKAKDTWVSGMAQIFSSCSPAMFNEFEIEHVKRYYDRFGLVHYGCCEPLHNCIDDIRKMKTVRKISVSPWADVRIAAEKMGNEFIMARKPNPSYLASGSVAEDMARNEIRETLDICKSTNTPVEFILKDLTTLRNEPKRLSWWYEMAKSEIERS